MSSSEAQGSHAAPAIGSGDIKRRRVEELLPPPECVKVFLEDRASEGKGMEWQLKKQVCDAAEWALKALCRAHEDPRLKKEVRKLLAIHLFTTNLEVAQWSFTQQLKPGLEQRLSHLGRPLAEDFVKHNYASLLSCDIVTAAISEHPLVAIAKAAGRTPTQMDVLPIGQLVFQKHIDWTKPWTYPEDIYAHVLLMMAAGLDHAFQGVVAKIVTKYNADREASVGHESAPPKAFARVMTKARSKADYRDRTKPVSQNNVDLVRCLVLVETPHELVDVATALSTAFGGVVKAKNFFGASDAERAERFNMLPLMLTVVMDNEAPLGSFMQLPRVQEAIAAYIDVSDCTVPMHRWNATTAAARQILESGSMASTKVQLLGELQLVLKPHGSVRHQMHEVYKAWRADSTELLYEDYLRTQNVRQPDEASKGLVFAAESGNCPFVELHLSKGGFPDSHIGYALFYASQHGHTDIVRTLLQSRADVDVDWKFEGSTTALVVAARLGHFDIVKLLLNEGAKPDVPDSYKRPPLFFAVWQGYRDVVDVLLKYEASVSAAMLFEGVMRGFSVIVESLLGADPPPDVNACDSQGRTALHHASCDGHLDTVNVLLRAGATTTTLSHRSETPLAEARRAGHADVIDALLAGSDARD